MNWLSISGAHGEAAIDPAVGNIRRLSLRSAGRTIEPLHTAPWVGQPDAGGIADMPPVDRNLAGDFLCAPFGLADVEPSPPHGWSANSAWSLRRHGSDRMTLGLVRAVMGATIVKTLRLGRRAPLLFQRHLITGGAGGLTVAHHPMVRLAGRASLCLSPKRLAIAPDEALEPGRNHLAIGATSADLHGFPAAGGGCVDLCDLPIATGCEDFVTLVEAEGTGMGWSAVIREHEDDILFFVKDPEVLPVTMIWHSNGGRDRAPWNGRHTGVVGLEDGCAAGAAGHGASLRPNPVQACGVPTFLELGGTHRITHVTGAIARPPGWTRLTGMSLGDAGLVLRDAGGRERTLPLTQSERSYFPGATPSA